MDTIEARYDLWKQNKLAKESLMEMIWVRYYPRIQTYAENFTGSRSDSSDLASGILLQVLEQLDTYKRDYAFSTWIYSVARHTLIDALRKKDPVRTFPDDEIASGHSSPEDDFQRENDIHMIRQAIGELSPRERELIFLSFYEGLKYSEISLITGVPEGTIKYRMSECRKKLKIKLERSEVV